MQHEITQVDPCSYERGSFEEIYASNSMYGEINSFINFDEMGLFEESQQQKHNSSNNMPSSSFFPSFQGDEFSYRTQKDDLIKAPEWYGENIDLSCLSQTESENRLIESTETKTFQHNSSTPSYLSRNFDINLTLGLDTHLVKAALVPSDSRSPSPSPSPPPSPPSKKRKASSPPPTLPSLLSRQSRTEERSQNSNLTRKERNKIAAQMYRKKLRDESNHIEIRCQHLTKENAELRGEIDATRDKIVEFKNILYSLKLDRFIY